MPPSTPAATGVSARVGLLLVSVADAHANLPPEDPGSARRRRPPRRSELEPLARRSPSRPIAPPAHTFYTSLYHALLAPRTFSDVGGSYLGMDGADRARGRIQYADFSGWTSTGPSPAALAARPPPRPADRPLAARRRRAERLPSALVVAARQR